MASALGGTRRVAAVLAAACFAWPAAGAEHFAAPNGTPGGQGTKSSPLDLAAALGAGSRAKPGDTIWLRGGTYRGGLTSTVGGRADAPVTIRAVPGERATIDCRSRQGQQGSTLFSVEGDWTVVRDLEVTCSDPKRVTKITGSHPNDIRRGGISCRASGVKFVNLVVHDCSNGLGFWSGGAGGEVYGCLIYNNGWLAPDRGHGHAIYAQNKTGTKRLVDNILFNQFSYGLHAYGSGRAFLSGFHVEGNVSFNNGSAAGRDRRTPAVLIGGGCTAERITLADNCTYGSGPGGGAVRLGYSWGRKLNRDAVVRGNYLVGDVDLRFWEQVTFTNNTVIAPGTLVGVTLPKGGGTGKYRMERNTYFRTGKGRGAFGLAAEGGGSSLAFAEWQKRLGEGQSTFAAARPAGVKVFVRPNRYEPGRAHVVVYNWARRPDVAADLGAVLEKGAKFRIVSVQDFYGDPVVAGTFDGRPVRIPMAAYRAVPPIGLPGHKPPVTGPEFNAFVVLPGR